MDKTNRLKKIFNKYTEGNQDNKKIVDKKEKGNKVIENEDTKINLRKSTIKAKENIINNDKKQNEETKKNSLKLNENKITIDRTEFIRKKKGKKLGLNDSKIDSFIKNENTERKFNVLNTEQNRRMEKYKTDKKLFVDKEKEKEKDKENKSPFIPKIYSNQLSSKKASNNLASSLKNKINKAQIQTKEDQDQINDTNDSKYTSSNKKSPKRSHSRNSSSETSELISKKEDDTSRTTLATNTLNSNISNSNAYTNPSTVTKQNIKIEKQSPYKNETSLPKRKYKNNSLLFIKQTLNSINNNGPQTNRGNFDILKTDRNEQSPLHQLNQNINHMNMISDASSLTNLNDLNVQSIQSSSKLKEYCNFGKNHHVMDRVAKKYSFNRSLNITNQLNNNNNIKENNISKDNINENKDDDGDDDNNNNNIYQDDNCLKLNLNNINRSNDGYQNPLTLRNFNTITDSNNKNNEKNASNFSRYMFTNRLNNNNKNKLLKTGQLLNTSNTSNNMDACQNNQSNCIKMTNLNINNINNLNSSNNSIKNMINKSTNYDNNNIISNNLNINNEIKQNKNYSISKNKNDPIRRQIDNLNLNLNSFQYDAPNPQSNIGNQSYRKTENKKYFFQPGTDSIPIKNTINTTNQGNKTSRKIEIMNQKMSFNYSPNHINSNNIIRNNNNNLHPANPPIQSTLINIQELLLLEEQFTQILYSINAFSPNLHNECFELIAFFQYSFLLTKFENYFKSEDSRLTVHSSLLGTFFTIILIYDITFNKIFFKRNSVYVINIIQLYHKSYLLLCEYILTKINPSERQNIFVKKLSSMLDVKLVHVNSNNSEFINFSQMHSRENSNPIINEIKYNNMLVVKLMRVLLRNCFSNGVKEDFGYFFTNIGSIGIEELILFFRRKILRVFNSHASVLGVDFKLNGGSNNGSKNNRFNSMDKKGNKENNNAGYNPLSKNIQNISIENNNNIPNINSQNFSYSKKKYSQNNLQYINTNPNLSIKNISTYTDLNRCNSNSNFPNNYNKNVNSSYTSSNINTNYNSNNPQYPNSSSLNSSFDPPDPPVPYLPHKPSHPYTLVLDLDETLICYQSSPINNQKNSLHIRPYITDFLDKVSHYYEIIIFTSGTEDYADPLLDIIEKNKKYFEYRLYRQHAIIVDNDFVKDLSLIGRDLSKIIIVDNMPQNFRLQKDNGIYIKSYWGNDPNDNALLYLGDILEKIAINFVDVREGISVFKDDIVSKVTSKFFSMDVKEG